MYSLGIDIGYSSVKVVLTGADSGIRYQRYQLHKGDAKRLVRQFINEISDTISITDEAFGAVTGSGAMLFNGAGGVSSVNEVTALVEGAVAVGGPVRSIIEIGGQGAKYITGLGSGGGSGIKLAMNSSCSAGTGSFLEEQMSRLNLRLEDYSILASKAGTIPRIAGRCSVFAKTDIIHHQQEGMPAADILLGLAYAVVRNYRVSVMRKLRMEKPVLLAGGLALNQGVLIALKDLLSLGDGDLIAPDEAAVLGAVGAALIAARERRPVDIERLLDDLEQTVGGAEEEDESLPSLSGFGRRDASGKHDIGLSVGPDVVTDCYLGLDVGSTSTNLVLADGRDRIIAFRYLRTLGDPAAAVRRGLASLEKQVGGRVNVLGACSTGSGRYMTGRLVGADLVKDEITAQARAAVHLDPTVETVFEIGGQDSKFISLKNGAVIDFQMNKICAAGTGSFIEEQAKKFNIDLTELGDLALKAAHPINLGERCTVFMETSIASHLGRGAELTDITAGLCYSIVNNYLNRVVGRKRIGDRVLLQGGIAYNQGVVNAFRLLTGKDIVVPQFFSVTGAYGAAILAREAMAGRRTTFRGFNPSSDGRAAYDKRKVKNGLPEYSQFNQAASALVFQGFNGRLDPEKKTVGIPRALFTYGMFSMFYTIFTELGFNVLLSDPSGEKTIALGQEYSLDETCYPVKLINGHVAELVNKRVDYIFFPDLYTVDHPGSPSRQNYGCAYMQLAFKMVNQAMDLESRGIGLLSPVIAFSLGREFMMKSFSDLGRRLGKSPEETVNALQKGIQAFHDFEGRLEQSRKTALEKLDPNKKAFVIISKIYGVADPVLNMGIPDKLLGMGYQVLPFYFIPEGDLASEHPNMYWPFGQHILEPAQFVREHPNLYAVLLTHHGCGPDSALTHFFREEMQGKPYLHIEVDEHSSGVGVATRVEAFVNSLENRPIQRAESTAAYQGRISRKDENILSDLTGLSPNSRLYLPPMHPYADITAALLTANGVPAETLPPTSRETADLGRKYTLVEEYFSLTALIGDVFGKSRSNGDGGPLAFLIPRTEGAEVDGQYNRLLRTKLDEEGFSDVSIVSPFLEDLLDAEENDVRSLFLGMIAGDLIRSAPSNDRHALLQGVLDQARGQRLTLDAVRILAREVRLMVQNRSWIKRILIIGEPMIIFNDYLNDHLFETLASRGHRLLYAPFSEAMWLFWRDHADQNGKSEKRLRLLDRFSRDIKSIHKCLGQDSPFEADINTLVLRADETIGYYAGAFGRFRGAKALLADKRSIDGIITAASTYENTGISLNVLHKMFAREQTKPVLNLTFDGNRNQSDETRCEAFLSYL